jgi:acetyl esterase
MPLHPQSLALIDAAKKAGRPAYYELDGPVAARRQFIETRGPLFPPVPDIGPVRDLAIPAPHGSVAARLCRPLASAPDVALPVLVFFHGGGWVVGDVDTHDILCRLLSNYANCAVLSVHYRLAPEHKFPAAFDDALLATRYVAANAKSLGVDASRIAVGGDSAGGNLAAAVALALRDQGGPALRMQVLIYPVTDMSMQTESYRTLGNDYLLTHALMNYFKDCYLRNPADVKDWRASPLLAASHAKLPPAHVATAEFDPLRDEGKLYADRLKEAGVPVSYRCHEGMLHGFFLYGGKVDPADAAVREAAEALRKAFV